MRVLTGSRQMSSLLHPIDPALALAELVKRYGCAVPPGGRWFIRGPGGAPLPRTEVADSATPGASGASAATAAPVPDDEDITDAHSLLDTLAAAPADIAIVYGAGEHSRSIRISLEIADLLARPLTLLGI